MSNKLIVLSGFKGSGKDVVGSWLAANRNYKVEAFAYHAACYVAHTYNIPLHTLREPGLKELPLFNRAINPSTEAFIPEYLNISSQYFTPRDIVKLEANMKRVIDLHFWTDIVINQIRLNNTPSVITDWRFMDQIERIKDSLSNYDITTIRINRFDNPNLNDITEIELNDYSFDLVIDNKGSLEELYEKLENLYL